MQKRREHHADHEHHHAHVEPVREGVSINIPEIAGVLDRIKQLQKKNERTKKICKCGSASCRIGPFKTVKY